MVQSPNIQGLRQTRHAARASVADRLFVDDFGALQAALEEVGPKDRWRVWLNAEEEWLHEQAPRIATAMADRVSGAVDLVPVLRALGEVPPEECAGMCPPWLRRLGVLRFGALDGACRDQECWATVPEWARSWLEHCWLWSADDAWSYTRGRLPARLADAASEECELLLVAMRAEGSRMNGTERRSVL